jgi:gamma-glutamyl hydrolase
MNLVFLIAISWCIAATSGLELVEKTTRHELFAAEPLNDEPIIGILVLDKSYSVEAKFPGHESYIAASYVKFVEGGGARVVPVW